ncbi:MAG: sensor histidine kinase [Blautia marasmi]
MKQFGEGRYEIDAAPTEYQQDEIGLLYKNFDTMVEKINTLINENYVNELLKKEAQIKAMESQMDPTFYITHWILSTGGHA